MITMFLVSISVNITKHKVKIAVHDTEFKINVSPLKVILIMRLQAQATISALHPSDRSTIERLGQNWTAQLHMEEDFINGVYHHLYYTLQMVWERILKALDSTADDIEEAQARFQVTVGFLSFGPIEKIMFSVTSACARRTGAAVRVVQRRRER